MTYFCFHSMRAKLNNSPWLWLNEATRYVDGRTILASCSDGVYSERCALNKTMQ